MRVIVQSKIVVFIPYIASAFDIIYDLAVAFTVYTLRPNENKTNPKELEIH